MIWYVFFMDTNQDKQQKEDKMNKQQKEIVKRINKAYSKLYILSNITWTPYRDDLFKMNRKDEKQHRVGDWSEYHKDAASISDCAKMFTVKHIAQNLLIEINLKDINLNEDDFANREIKIMYSERF